MYASNFLLSSSLPFELIEEILYRTPADSLLRFKSTCKQWKDLINDKKFIYKNLEYSQKRFIRTKYGETNYIMMDQVTKSPSISPIPEEFRNQSVIYSMINCDGLLLCTYAGSIDKVCKLSVWNPILRELIEVMVDNRDYYGIGYDKKDRDNYKILYLPNTSKSECKIYEFIKSGSWRTIDAKSDLEVEERSQGLSVKGNMYWIAVKDKKDHMIMSFDFSKETFKEVCVCPYNIRIRFECFNGDGLSLLQHDENTGIIHVWLTNKLCDEVVSFSKFFNVVSPGLRALNFNYKNSAAYFIGKHKNITAWFETLKTECCRVRGHVHCCCRVYPSIELYKIDKGGAVKRTETRLFDTLLHYGLRLTRYCVFSPSLVPVPKLRDRYEDCLCS